MLGGWVGQWVVSCQITKNQINLDLIEIIQFCLKISDLWRHPHIFNYIHFGHFLDIFWTFFGHFYLNNLSPLLGYLFNCLNLVVP